MNNCISNNDTISRDTVDRCLNVAGHYGTVKCSANGRFFVVTNTLLNESGNRTMSLVTNDELIYSIEIGEYGGDCVSVSNIGIVAYIDRYDRLYKLTYYIILNEEGKFICEIPTKTYTFDFTISSTGKYLLLIDYNIFMVYDGVTSRQISEFFPRFVWHKMTIDEGNNILLFYDGSKNKIKVNFEGNIINKEEYETSLKENGSIYENLRYMELNSNADDEHVLLLDKRYEYYLKLSLDSTQMYPEYKKDSVLKLLGEIALLKGNLGDTYLYWETAIKINPKIGLKGKLEKLVKRIKNEGYNI